MKLQLDTTNKTIKIEELVNLQELTDALEKLLPDGCEVFHWSVEISDALAEGGSKIQSTSPISNGLAMEEHPGLK